MSLPPSPNPSIRFEKAPRIDTSKFKNKIEPLSDELEATNQKITHKMKKVLRGDPEGVITNSCAYGLCALTFIACALFCPVSPFMMFALLGCGGVWGFHSATDLHILVSKVPAFEKQIKRNQELQRALKTDEFTSLSELESNVDFYKRIFHKIDAEELTKSDVKALLCIHRSLTKDPSLAETFVKDLEKEWDSNRRVVDWTRRINSL